MASGDHCEACISKAKFNNAVELCTDCDERLCEECSVNHLAFKAFKLHHLIRLTSIPANFSSFDKWCPLHEKKILDFYCSKHDATCCRVCIPEAHQSCKNVLPLEVASKDIQNSSLLNDILEELINIVNTLQTALNLNETNMKSIDSTANSIIQEIAAYKIRLIKQLDDLEQQCLQNLITNQTHLKTEIEKNNSYIAEKIAKTEQRKQDLKFLKEHGTNNQMFLALHKYDKEIEETGMKISEMISACRQTDIQYDKTIIDIECLGKIIQTSRPCDIQYTPIKFRQTQTQSGNNLKSLTKFKRDSDITLKQGEHYNLTDIAVTDDNKLLLCNSIYKNSKVYIYTDCEHFEKELIFSSQTYKIAVIPGTNRAIVTQRDEKSIQFVNTATMITEDKIKLSFEPLSVTASSERIFIGGSVEVHIFDTNGVFQKDIPICGIDNIHSIRLNKHNSEIVCRDSVKMFCVDVDGHILYQYDVYRGAGIAVDGHGDVYIGDYDSHTIYKLSPEGKLREIILTEDDGINLPFAMTFNNDFNNLFVVDNCRKVTCYTFK